MKIEVCRDLLERTLAMNLKNSSIAAEILYEPSYVSQGKTVYCQVRKRNSEFYICYEHFSRYDARLLECTEISADFGDDFLTDNFCGIKMLDNEGQRSIEKRIEEISKIKCRKIRSALGLDGYSHTVVINGRSFYWWCEPVSDNAKLLNELVSAVFSFLPEEFRRIEQ
ncbi:MAG: hypothetical protein ACI4J0_11170 [Huintestinicola sp.]|uniref:hypothetical protein n=1 Tax=Huintestinicola sp. TaxID=2981661 RepID=UPI003F11A03E